MEPIVLGKDFVPLSVVSFYDSLIWTDRYTECGDFEISFPCASFNPDIFQNGNYVIIEESEKTMIIESIEKKDSQEDGDMCNVSGRSLESILDRRLIWDKQSFTDKPIQEVVEALLNSEFINPTNEDRKVPNFIFRSNPDPRLAEIKITDEYDKKTVYDSVKDICDKKHVGMSMTVEDGVFVFSLFIGMDRTYEQTENTFVIFSPEFGNFTDTTYTQDSKEYKNVIVVTGDKDAKTVVGEASGLDRREGTVSTDKTLGAEETGKKELEKKKITDMLDGEMTQMKYSEYGVDFFIGDIVQAENKYGDSGRFRVSEMIHSCDDSGYKHYPTFTNIEEEENN